MSIPPKQIFYDRTLARWQYSRRTAISIVAFLVALSGVMIGSIVIRPALPQLKLSSPQLHYRGAPNVPKTATALTAAQNNNAVFQLPQTANNNFSNNPFTQKSQQKNIAFFVNWDDNSTTSLNANLQNLDELMPEWLHLGDNGGGILINDQAKQDQTMAYIKQNRPDLPIAVLINNFNQDNQDWDSGRLVKIISDSNVRAAAIKNLLQIVRSNGFSGVNIDFESVPVDQQPNLVLFMQELYATFHPLNLEVSQSVPLDDDSFDLKTLSQSSDFLVLMAYDQNSIYDTLAGPIASQSWFARSFTKVLTKLAPEKIVVAIGGYGYDWEDGKKTGAELNFQDAITTARESSAEVALDPKTLNPTFDYYDDTNILHHVWFMDAVQNFNQIYTANRIAMTRGFALWRLGSEDPGVWKVLDHKAELNIGMANTLKSMDYGYDVTYEGDGEVLRITGTPKTGSREINYDAQSGFITGEKITDYPASYVISRWGAEDKKKIALTFDDGPDSNYTPAILDILKKYNVPATFFIMGLNANNNPNLLRRIVSEGSEVGNHTYTHPNIIKISPEQFRFELDATERLFEGILGRKSLLFRPPYAEDIEPSTPEQAQPLVKTNELGYYTVGMHIDPKDWAKPGVDSIVNAVVAGAINGDGNAVLLHDGGGNRSQTVEALPKIIEQLKANGFQLVLVSDLIGISRDEAMPTVSAREQFVARLNGTAFVGLSIFNDFIYAMFIIGIILGVMRFLFICTLAIAQWLHSRRGAYREKSLFYNPNVDVIIPAYNEEAVITKTVQAILHSTYTNFHITVIDDGSSDRTFEMLTEKFSDNGLVTLYSKENGGKSEALNFGIAKTHAEIIVTLDADTLFKHDTIEKLIRKFVDKRIAAVAGNAKVGNRVNILTRWQALEYITSQNLDRRAFEIINCITVVPGAVGAWKRSALLEAGGFSNDTLAEDADLTFSIIRNGHRVAYDDEAIGLTEAPDSVKNFLKQRFRWMYGMLQTAWKHFDILGRPRYHALGFFAVPNVLIFQIFFPLISPLMDLMLIVTMIWTFWQRQSHQVDFSSTHTFREVILYYLIFTVVDLFTAAVPFLLERKEDWKLLIWLPLQRFFYRQLIYYIAIKTVVAAIKGALVGWGKFERKATVEEEVDS